MVNVGPPAGGAGHRRSLPYEILAAVASVATIVATGLSIHTFTQSGDLDALRSTVDSLQRQNSDLRENNEALNDELSTVSAERDRLKTGADAPPGPPSAPAAAGYVGRTLRIPAEGCRAAGAELDEGKVVLPWTNGGENEIRFDDGTCVSKEVVLETNSAQGSAA